MAEGGLPWLARAGSRSFSPSYSPSYSRVSDSPNGTVWAWGSDESLWTPTSSVEGDERTWGGGWGRERKNAANDGLWDKTFAELVGFKQAHGHVVVRQARKDPQKKRLGAWVQHQRKLYSLGTLARERCDRLAGLGFQWDVMESVWEGMFAKLVQYHAIFGNTDVPQSAGPHRDLGRWVCTQRCFRRKGRLRKDRELRLERLGFRWDERHTWDESLRRLMLFRQHTGTCDVHMAADRMLCRWVHGQRSFYTQGKLSAERQQQLERTGMAMSLHDLSWEGYYQAATHFRQQHGHTEFGRVGGPRGRELMDWKHRQRRLQREGELRPERRRRMEALGVTLGSSRCDFWEACLAELRDFRAMFGHTVVPQDYVNLNVSLGTWVHNQRMLRKKGALAPDRVKRLDSVGFSWLGPRSAHASSPTAREGAVQRRRGRVVAVAPRQGKLRKPRSRKRQARGGSSSSRSPRSRGSDSGGTESSSLGLTSSSVAVVALSSENSV